MKKIDLICSNCGANMQISEDRTQAFCPYCKTSILIDKESSIEELSKREEKLSYARKTGEAKALEDSVQRQKKRKIKIIIISILILVAITIVSYLVKYFSLEYMKNPFECISVKFTGINGKGEAKNYK